MDFLFSIVLPQAPHLSITYPGLSQLLKMEEKLSTGLNENAVLDTRSWGLRQSAGEDD